MYFGNCSDCPKRSSVQATKCEFTRVNDHFSNAEMVNSRGGLNSYCKVLLTRRPNIIKPTETLTDIMIVIKQGLFESILIYLVLTRKLSENSARSEDELSQNNFLIIWKQFNILCQTNLS